MTGTSRKSKKDSTCSHSSEGKGNRGRASWGEGGVEGGVVLEEEEEEEEEVTMDRPARPTGVCVVDDQRAALLCRGLSPSEDAAAAATAVTAPPAPPAVVVALARSTVTPTSSAPATPRCPPAPASSPAWMAEKRRVVMPGLVGWVGRLPPSGWPPPAGWVVVGPSWWWWGVCVWWR
jgi:hypothetical protein